jgi:hypothetical protein
VIVELTSFPPYELMVDNTFLPKVLRIPLA